MNDIVKWGKLDKKYIKEFYFLLILLFIYVLPIIMADRCYEDDLARALYGATGWKGDGRPLTEYLLRFLCGGSQGVVDISPFPLLLSVLLLAYTLMLYARERLSLFPWNVVKTYALFLVIANPFLLSNLSYKFDSVSMILALCFMLVVHSVPDCVAVKWLFIITLVLDSISLQLYQPVIGAQIGLSLINIMFLLLASKKKLGREFVKMFALGISCLFYKVVIASIFVDKTGWRHEASKIVSSREEIGGLIENFECLLARMSITICSIPTYVAIIFVSIFIGALVVILQMLLKQDNKLFWKMAGSIYMIFLPVMLVISGILPLLVLENLPINDRLFISFSIFSLYAGIMFMILSQKFKYVVAMAAMACLIFHFSYAYAYGNALESQKEYETYMVYNIQHDIESINSEGEFGRISISGEMSRAPELEMICNRYPQFYDTVPVYINNSGWLGGAWLCRYMHERLELADMESEDYEIVNHTVPIMKNSMYSCYVNGDKIIIHLAE